MLVPPADPLDPATVAVLAAEAPLFEHLCDVLAGGRGIRRGVHERELDKASRPPVINVTVTSPDGMPLPGHYRVDATGPNPVTTWHDEPAPDLRQTRPIMHVTGRHHKEEGRVLPWAA